MTAPRLTDVIASRRVRAYFEETEDAGTRRFLHSTRPGNVTYYVFLWRDDPCDDWRDGKASQDSLLTGTWRPREPS